MFTFLNTAHATETNYSTDVRYQSLAEDFRTYSVCQSIHQNLAMFIAINYGVGANLNFPPEWLGQQESLLQNISGHEREFGEKLAMTMILLSKEFNLPLPGLEKQKAQNQSNTTQSIIFSIAGSINDPSKAIQIVKNMLNESMVCRQYQSKSD